MDVDTVVFDFDKMTILEWRALFNSKQSHEEADATVAKVCGVKPEDIGALPYPKFKKLIKRFFAEAGALDPN